MFEPNVLNYFLVLLGGFGVVWSYRHARKKGHEKIGEFEYAAFSTLWGIPVFFVLYEIIKAKPDAVNSMFVMPMMASPLLFLLGVGFGFLGGKIVDLFLVTRERLQNR